MAFWAKSLKQFDGSPPADWKKKAEEDSSLLVWGAPMWTPRRTEKERRTQKKISARVKQLIPNRFDEFWDGWN